MARLEPLLGNSPDPAQITFSEFLCFNVIREFQRRSWFMSIRVDRDSPIFRIPLSSWVALRTKAQSPFSFFRELRSFVSVEPSEKWKTRTIPVWS